MESIENIDRVIHEKARLAILASLVSAPAGILFADLKLTCSLTDGNLNRHLKVLEDAKLVSIRRQGSGRSSQTRVRMTASGKREFELYLQALEQIVESARAASRAAGADGAVSRPDPATG